MSPTTIGPATVSTTTNIFYPADTYQRCVFYTAGRFWYWYSDGTNLCFRSSLDGVNWNAPTTVRACTDGRYMSICFDGTYVHYTYCPWVNNNPLQYRRGQPNSDGTITWSAAEQTARTAVATAYFRFITVAVDTSGHAYIGYEYEFSIPCVTRNDNIDGTWSTSAGYPKEFPSLGTCYPTIISLLGDRMYFFISSPARGYLYDGTNWGGIESPGYNCDNEFFSTIPDGDDVLLGYDDSVNKDLYFGRRTFGVGWGAAVKVYTNISDLGLLSPNLSVISGILYYFWLPNVNEPTSYHIWYRKSVDGGMTWTNEAGADANQDWIDESVDRFGLSYTHRAFPSSYQGKIGIAYQTKLVSPYNLRFAALDFYSPGSADLKAKATIRQGSVDLKAKATIKPTLVDLKAKAVIRKSNSRNLKAVATIISKTLRFSLREHHYGSGGYPNVTFSKPSGSVVRAQSDTSGSNARAIIFISVPRAWLHGKYLRFRWQGWSSWSGMEISARILDGEYVRSSNTDFPDGSDMPAKGNGLLQTLRSKSGTFTWETFDVQANVSGGNQDRCTILFRLTDAWTGQSGYFDVDWLEINSASGGSGNLYSETFDDSVHMEVTGTYGDYGYISNGDVPFEVEGTPRSLKAVASVRHSYDYITVIDSEEVRLNGRNDYLPAYLYRSKTLAGQFSMKGEVKILSATEDHGGAYFCALAQSALPIQYLLVIGAKVVTPVIIKDGANFVIALGVQESGVDYEIGDDVIISADTTYYFHLHRDASSHVYLDIYSDPEFSVLVGSSVCDAEAHSATYDYWMAIDAGGYSGNPNPAYDGVVRIYRFRNIVI